MLLTNNDLEDTGFGLETIDFQTDDFHKKLTEWVVKLKANLNEFSKTKNTKEIVADVNELSKMIKDRFNLNMSVGVDLGYGNLSCSAPILQKNTGEQYPNHRKEGDHSGSFYKYFESVLKEGAPGWLDQKKAKAFGVFSKIPGYLIVGAPIVMSPRYTERGVASFILHEIGHFWNTLSSVGNAYMFCQGMSAIHREMSLVQEPEQRKVILEYLVDSKYTNIDRETLDKIVDYPPEKIVTVLVTDKVVELRSQTGIQHYERKASEQGADLFASRFGAGEDLIKALAVNGHANLTKQYQTSSNFINKIYLLASLTVSTVVAISPLATPLAIVPLIAGTLMFDTEPDSSNYDAHINRLDKVRQQLIVQLKNPSLDKRTVDIKLAELESANLIISMYKEIKPFMERLKVIVSKRYRSSVRQAEILYHLERMANNKLFASASKIKSLL